MAATAASRTWGSRASAAPASAPRPLKVGRIWIGGVAGVETGVSERVTPDALAPKATVRPLQAPGRTAGSGIVKPTEPVELGCISLSNATPPERLRTPPLAAVEASAPSTGSATVPGAV